MEQNNGRGVFYGVIGVATLIVAIVGATFAYFSASASNANVIVGNTSEASNLSLTVTKMAADGNLIPMFDADLATGITGDSTNGNCVDANGNTVCHVYEIALTNGKSPVQIAGEINFTTQATNLVYYVLDKDVSSNDRKEIDDFETLAANKTGIVLGTKATLDTSTAFEANETKYYYVVVWLRDTSAAQETADASKNYVGTVTFNAAGGGGVTATFAS